MDALLREWKIALQLGRWEIDLRMVKPGDLKRAVGRVEYWVEEDPTPPRAVIKIVDSSQVDQEVTLVHELLHLVFDPLDVKQPFHRREEEVLDTIAYCLVNTKRNVTLARAA